MTRRSTEASVCPTSEGCYSQTQCVRLGMSVGGWTSPSQLSYLVGQVFACPNGSVIVEIGVWKGRSAVAMGAACRGADKTVYAVDPWVDYETTKGSLQTRIQEFGEESIESVYEQFLGRRRELSLEAQIVVIRAASADAAREWRGRRPSMVFIDGQHSYEAVTTDLELWSSLLEPGGILCGDDWKLSGVRRAVRSFASSSGLKIVLPVQNTWELRHRVTPRSFLPRLRYGKYRLVAVVSTIARRARRILPEGLYRNK